MPLLLLQMYNIYILECPPGYYGIGCDTKCGKCAGNETCDGISGVCPKDCLGNWQEPKCNGKESLNLTCSKGMKYILFRSRAICETSNKYGFSVDTSFKINRFVIGNNYSVNLYFPTYFVNSMNFNLAFTSECLKFMQRKVMFGLSPLSRKDSSVKTSRNTFKIHDEN